MRLTGPARNRDQTGATGTIESTHAGAVNLERPARKTARPNRRKLFPACASSHRRGSHGLQPTAVPDPGCCAIARSCAQVAQRGPALANQLLSGILAEMPWTRAESPVALRATASTGENQFAVALRASVVLLCCSEFVALVGAEPTDTSSRLLILDEPLLMGSQALFFGNLTRKLDPSH